LKTRARSPYVHPENFPGGDGGERLRQIPQAKDVNMFRTCLILALALACAAQTVPPVRLQITVLPGTLRLGEKARIDVQFLGRDYRPAVNDANRVVQLTWLALDSGATGSITPSSIAVPPGVAHSADASFACGAPGRFQIIAKSAGLLESRTIVVGVRPGASRIGKWLVPSVLAESNQTVQIFPPHPQQGLIANGRSRVGLKLVLGHPVQPGENVTVLLTTSSEARINYHDQVSSAALSIPIAEGSLTSDDIYLSATHAQELEVTARVSPGAFTDKITMRFAPPKPAKVFVELPGLPFQHGRPEAQAEVGIEDQDQVPIGVLETEHPIQLYSGGDPQHNLISIDPSTVRLTPKSSRRRVVLRMNGYPPGGEIELQAKDADADLDSYVTTLTVQNCARKAQIIGPRQLRTNDRTFSVVVELLDEHGKNVTADWDTQVSLHSDQLLPADTTVKIPKGKSQITTTYKLPRWSHRATVIGSLGDVPHSERSTYGLAIVAAMYALILLACLGGTLGALARQFFFEEIRFLRPRWVDGCLHAGLMGNTSFGALFGTVAFMAFEFGLFRQFGIWASVSDSLGDSSVQAGPAAVAFLLGFVGGYGGPILLDRMLRIKRKPAASATATP